MIKDIQYNSKSSNYKRYLKLLLQMSVGGGTSRADALLEERRRLLRTALKGEYIRSACWSDHLTDNKVKIVGRSTTLRRTLPKEALSLTLLSKGTSFH